MFPRQRKFGTTDGNDSCTSILDMWRVLLHFHTELLVSPAAVIIRCIRPDRRRCCVLIGDHLYVLKQSDCRVSGGDGALSPKFNFLLLTTMNIYNSYYFKFRAAENIKTENDYDVLLPLRCQLQTAATAARETSGAASCPLQPQPVTGQQ